MNTKMTRRLCKTQVENQGKIEHRGRDIPVALQKRWFAKMTYYSGDVRQR